MVGFEVIVVDNGSTDGSVEYLRDLERQINFSQSTPLKVIFNDYNLGFSKANNQGFKISRGEYILFLNPDTLIFKNPLKLMIKWLKDHPHVGVLGCQILDKERKVLSSGGFFPNLWRVFLWSSGLDHLVLVSNLFGGYHPPASFFKKEQPLDWIQGCALLLRRKAFEDAGGFDREFFMYEEEVELCYRIKKGDWKIWFLPKPKIIHLGGEKKTASILGEMKGLLLFYQKHYPSWYLPFLRILIKLGSFFRIILFGIIRKDGYLKDIYSKAKQIV